MARVTLVDVGPFYDSTCGGLKSFLQHVDEEFVMIFLMGLNNEYAIFRAQILHMNLIPVNVKSVFSC